MKTAKEIRKEAWNALSKNYGLAILTVLIQSAILGAVAFTGVGTIILAGPLAVGVIIIFTGILKKKEVKFENMFDGFTKCFVNSVSTYLLQAIFTFLWSLLFIIPGIIKSYSYSQSLYIQNDHPEKSGTEAIDESKEMMKGYKWQLFCLDLSFIGWIILSIFTFGILLLWVIPYQQMAHVIFYEDLKKLQGKEVKEKTEEDDIFAINEDF